MADDMVAERLAEWTLIILLIDMLGSLIFCIPTIFLQIMSLQYQHQPRQLIKKDTEALVNGAFWLTVTCFYALVLNYIIMQYILRETTLRRAHCLIGKGVQMLIYASYILMFYSYQWKPPAIASGVFLVLTFLTLALMVESKDICTSEPEFPSILNDFAHNDSLDIESAARPPTRRGRPGCLSSFPPTYEQAVGTFSFEPAQSGPQENISELTAPYSYEWSNNELPPTYEDAVEFLVGQESESQSLAEEGTTTPYINPEPIFV